MSVLGIDLSGFSCGWAVVEKSGRLGAHGLIEPDNTKNFWDRQQEVVDRIRHILRMQEKAYDPVRRVVIERIRLFHRGGISLDAIRDLARLSGSIGYFVNELRAEIVEVHVGHWRKRVLGDGRAKKDDVVAWVLKNYGIESEKPDEAEAICLALYGQMAAAPTATKTRPTPTRRKRRHKSSGYRRANRRSRVKVARPNHK